MCSEWCSCVAKLPKNGCGAVGCSVSKRATTFRKLFSAPSRVTSFGGSKLCAESGSLNPGFIPLVRSEFFTSGAINVRAIQGALKPKPSSEPRMASAMCWIICGNVHCPNVCTGPRANCSASASTSCRLWNLSRRRPSANNSVDTVAVSPRRPIMAVRTASPLWAASFPVTRGNCRESQEFPKMGTIPHPVYLTQKKGITAEIPESAGRAGPRQQTLLSQRSLRRILRV